MIQKNAQDTNSLYLKLMGNSLEIVIDNVLDFSNLLGIDNIFNDYVRISDKEYFEQFTRLSDNYSTGDLKRLYEYMNIRGEIYDTLETMTLSNKFIDSIYFYDYSRKFVFKNGERPVPLEQFSDKAWLKILENYTLLPYVMSIRTVSDEGGNTKNIISVISENMEENIPFIINIDGEILYREIVSSVGWDPENIFFILSETGEPLLYSGKDSHLIRKISILSENRKNEQSGLISVDNSDYIINSLKISPLGWTVYSAMDARKFRESIQPFRNTVFILSMLFFPLSLLLAYFLGQRLYKPIKKLSGYAQSHYSESPEMTSPGEGDLEWIWYSLKSSRMREKKLEEKLTESLPSYRNDFLKGLIFGQAYSIEDVLERLNFLSSSLKPENLAILLIQSDNGQKSKLTFPCTMVLNLEIESIITNEFLNRFDGECLSLPAGEFCVIFNYPSGGLQPILKDLEKLLDSLKLELSMNFTFGLGTEARSIFDLQNSYKEARDAIGLRSLADTGHLVFYEDINVGEKETAVFEISNRMPLLKDCIRAGHREEAIKVLDEIYTYLIEQGDSISFNKARQLYLTVFNESLNTVHEFGLDTESQLNWHTPYEDLFVLNTIEEINQWIMERIGDLTEKINALSHEKKSRKIEEIIAYIDRECGQEINLNIIADKINLNPSYVSRLFKENMHQSFIDYLTDVRIKKAMKLLKETDRKISEIGQETGYYNSNYFIRLFKKRTGRTPGEYRQLSR
ncbi:MAG: helix-turn-helix domain-containing protein [Spirochaetales bacterium]|nr:helix-turn-helix domain-containing protein [Spirochaetales bacterium]